MIPNKYIMSIVKVAYYGIYQYLRSFLDEPNRKTLEEIENECSELFDFSI
jgi:hypothetical protein